MDKGEVVEMETELIGITHVDNGVGMKVYVTEGGIRYGFWDCRDEDAEEQVLYNSKEMVIGLLKEQGYNPQDVTIREMALTLAYARVRDTMDIPMDSAMGIVNNEANAVYIKEVRKPQHHPRGTPGNMGANPTLEQIEHLNKVDPQFQDYVDMDEDEGYALSNGVANDFQAVLGSSLNHGEINYDEDGKLSEFVLTGKDRNGNDMQVKVSISRKPLSIVIEDEQNPVTELFNKVKDINFGDVYKAISGGR